MPLSQDSIDAVKDRLIRAQANSNGAVIAALTDKCRTEGMDADRAEEVLSLVEFLSTMLTTISNDVALLLEDRKELLDYLEVYAAVEDYLES